MSAEIIRIAPPSGAYDVVVGEGLLDELGDLLASRTFCKDAFIIADSTVASLYLERARTALEAAGFTVGSAVFPAGETHKNLPTLGELLEDMAKARLDRTGTVIALGGGVTGDMAGLAAALYMRGIAYVQVPTTLLSMVDSSVGGKCAVDLAAGKNLAGAFLQPSLVVADVRTLATLDDGVFSDGCAEVIKHAVLADPRLFESLSREALSKDDPHERLISVIARNIDIKRSFVESDEREQGPRKLLNLGHSIGHAVEAASGYTLGHGHAVSIGLSAITKAAEGLGWAEAGSAAAIIDALDRHHLPTSSPYPVDELIGYARLDKKCDADGITLAVPEGIGHASLRHVGFEEFARIIALGTGAS
ncbi:MAG TPA: 3-dehydroquinate synthase [Atopobiaceae bacterium]|nr:3-dehydroquinate synthase [Atopobiaceae bacterium]